MRFTFLAPICPSPFLQNIILSQFCNGSHKFTSQPLLLLMLYTKKKKKKKKKKTLKCMYILHTYEYSEFGTPITSISLPFIRILHILL